MAREQQECVATLEYFKETRLCKYEMTQVLSSKYLILSAASAVVHNRPNPDDVYTVQYSCNSKIFQTVKVLFDDFVWL